MNEHVAEICHSGVLFSQFCRYNLLLTQFKNDVFVSVERLVEGSVQNVITDINNKFNADD